MYSPGVRAVRAVWHTLRGRRPVGMTQKGHFQPSSAKSTRPRSDRACPQGGFIPSRECYRSCSPRCWIGGLATSENPLKAKLLEHTPDS
jgi:hypothetical protein